jgi:hypothetical protein
MLSHKHLRIFEPLHSPLHSVTFWDALRKANSTENSEEPPPSIHNLLIYSRLHTEQEKTERTENGKKKNSVASSFLLFKKPPSASTCLALMLEG